MRLKRATRATRPVSIIAGPITAIIGSREQLVPESSMSCRRAREERIGAGRPLLRIGELNEPRWSQSSTTSGASCRPKESVHEAGRELRTLGIGWRSPRLRPLPLCYIIQVREARTIRCPNCGGTTSEHSHRCDYCRAPVATVRCGYCYHMNIPDALHCSGCGGALGLEPAGNSDYLRCPSCKVDFDVFDGHPGKLRDCGQCGGQFVDHVLLKSLLERREAYGMAAPRPVRKWNPLTDPVRYLPCPVCRSPMGRKNFGGSSGVVIDVCPPHGFWFDRGELPRILAFVESGGLAQVRRRELQQLERQASQPEAVPARHILVAPEGQSEHGIADLALALIETIGHLL